MLYLLEGKYVHRGFGMLLHRFICSLYLWIDSVIDLSSIDYECFISWLVTQSGFFFFTTRSEVPRCLELIHASASLACLHKTDCPQNRHMLVDRTKVRIKFPISVMISQSSLIDLLTLSYYI